jgi:hypothetical protein
MGGGTYHNPGVPEVVDSSWQVRKACAGWELYLVTGANLVEGKADDDEAKDSVKVVLRWTADEGLGLDKVDDSAEGDLHQIESKDDDAPFLAMVD